MRARIAAEAAGAAVILFFLYYQVLPFFTQLIARDPLNSMMLRILELIVLGAPTVILPIMVASHALNPKQEGWQGPQDDPKEIPEFGFGSGFIKAEARWITKAGLDAGAMDLVRRDESMIEPSLEATIKIHGYSFPVGVMNSSFVLKGTEKEFTVRLDEKMRKMEEVKVGQE